jgi:hypothetical protein
MKESGSWEVKKMPEKWSISLSAGIETEPEHKYAKGQSHIRIEAIVTEDNYPGKAVTA